MKSWHVIRAVAYVAGTCLVLNSVALAQNLGTPVGSTDLDLVKWGLTQGGLVLVTLVILWSYRKDFKSVLAETRAELTVAVTLAKECSAHIAASSETNRSLTKALDELRAKL